MSNFNCKTNLLKLKNAFVKQMNSKAGMIDVIIIPIQMNHLFKSDKGVYLEQQGFEIKDKKPDSKDTHLMKLSIPKDIYNAMSEEERKNTPILGNAILWNSAPATSPNISNGGTGQQQAGSNAAAAPEDDDLPF